MILPEPKNPPFGGLSGIRLAKGLQGAYSVICRYVVSLPHQTYSVQVPALPAVKPMWTLFVVAGNKNNTKDRNQHCETALGLPHQTAVRRTKTVDLTGTRVGLLPASKEGKGKLIKFVVLKDTLSSRQTIRSLKDQDSSSVPIGLSDYYCP